MQSQKFYIVEAASQSWWWLKFRPDWISDLGGDEAAFRIMDNEYDSQEPLQLEILEGRRKSDLMGHDGGLLIASQRFVSVLKLAEATGLHTHPVTIMRKRSGIVDEDSVWLRLEVGINRPERRGYFDQTLSFFSRMKYGIYFDHKSWSGLDVFRLAVPRGMMIVTERIANALLDADLKGMEISVDTEYGRDRYKV